MTAPAPAAECPACHGAGRIRLPASPDTSYPEYVPCPCREVAALKAENVDLKKDYEVRYNLWADAMERLGTMEARAERAEAREKGLREALERLLDAVMGEALFFGENDPKFYLLGNPVEGAVCEARAALKEAK